jgi:hypothetical protein
LNMYTEAAAAASIAAGIAARFAVVLSVIA